MNSKDSSIFQVLNLSEYQQNLYSVKSSYTDEQLEFYKMQAKIVSANYFYCFNSIIENQPIPYIYVYDQRSSYKEQEIDLVKINKQLWTLGEIALALKCL